MMTVFADPGETGLDSSYNFRIGILWLHTQRDGPSQHKKHVFSWVDNGDRWGEKKGHATGRDKRQPTKLTNPVPLFLVKCNENPRILQHHCHCHFFPVLHPTSIFKPTTAPLTAEQTNVTTPLFSRNVKHSEHNGGVLKPWLGV